MSLPQKSIFWHQISYEEVSYSESHGLMNGLYNSQYSTILEPCEMQCDPGVVCGDPSREFYQNLKGFGYFAMCKQCQRDIGLPFSEWGRKNWRLVTYEEYQVWKVMDS